jgi:hypothetical protein
MPPEPDPAELVHRAAVPGVERQGSFLMLTRLGQVAAGQAYLAGEEVHIGLVRGQTAGPPGRFGGDVEPVSRQRGLGYADVRLPVAGREPARLVGRLQRGRVVGQVDQGVTGQAVRPLVGGIKGHRPVGGGDRVGVAVCA